MSETPAQGAPMAQPAEKHDHIHGQDGLNQLSTLKVYAHSPIFYWWPIWALGLTFGAISTFLPSETADVVSNAARVQGQTFVFVLLFIIFSTTVKLRGPLSEGED